MHAMYISSLTVMNGGVQPYVVCPNVSKFHQSQLKHESITLCTMGLNCSTRYMGSMFQENPEESLLQ